MENEDIVFVSQKDAAEHERAHLAKKVMYYMDLVMSLNKENKMLRDLLQCKQK